MPGNPGKKEELGGVSGGRRLKPHYACRDVEEEGEGREGEALLHWELMHVGRVGENGERGGGTASVRNCRFLV